MMWDVLTVLVRGMMTLFLVTVVVVGVLYAIDQYGLYRERQAWERRRAEMARQERSEVWR